MTVLKEALHTATSHLDRLQMDLRSFRVTLEVRHDLPRWQQALLTVGSIVLGLLLSGVALVAIGVEARELLRTFFVENFTIYENFRSVLTETSRLIIVGTAATVAFKVRFWNLGLEGQMIWGGIGAAAVSIYQIGPPVARLGLMLTGAVACAALWGLLALGMKRRFAANEIIITLLLNYIAINVLLHLLFGAWADPADAFPHSRQFLPFERLPLFSEHPMVAFAPALLVLAVAWWLMQRSRLGLYLRFVEANSAMAMASGLPMRSLTTGAVAVSAMLAGFAGFVICAGEQGRLTQAFFQNYGITGVLVAFLARSNPLVIGLVAFLMAVMFDTGRSLQVFNQIPFSMVQLAQALIVMVVASSEFFITHRLRIVRRAPHVDARG